MNKHHLILLAVGIAIGYFAAANLSAYQPWSTAYAKGGSFGV